MVFACFSHKDKLLPVATTTLDTQFLRPATGDILRCEAKVERAGKAIFFLSAVLITKPNDKIVAKSTATFYLAE
jgi:acyl-coenzyme A thioesterase PaaI-like protein